jgi:hypothetical protein
MLDSIETVSHASATLAIIVRAGYRLAEPGIAFFTPSTFSQQLGYMHRPAGHVIDAHIHKPVRRDVHFTREVLLIRTGRVRVDFYSESGEYVESRVLDAGDVILLASGGHGFEILEAAEIIEIKQGPYAGDADKVRFDAVRKEDVKIAP